jgi:hypothetical protein
LKEFVMFTNADNEPSANDGLRVLLNGIQAVHQVAGVAGQHIRTTAEIVAQPFTAVHEASQQIKQGWRDMLDDSNPSA